MPVRTATYQTIEGLTTLTVPELAYVKKVVGVKREGTGHELVDSIPVNRQVRYTREDGGFTFEIPFTGFYELGSGLTVRGLFWRPEKIKIIWDE